MGSSYAREKLGAAVYSLATSPGNIKTRLWGAYLSFHTLKDNDFPDEYKDDWKFIHDSLTTANPSVDDKGEVTTGKVQNTLKTLDEDVCIQIAERICDLESRLQYDLQ